jgi:hypothetical protein
LNKPISINTISNLGLCHSWFLYFLTRCTSVTHVTYIEFSPRILSQVPCYIISRFQFKFYTTQPFGAFVFNCFHIPFLPKTITTYHNHREQEVKIYFVFLIYQRNGFKLNCLLWAVLHLVLSGRNLSFLFIPGKETASMDLSHSREAVISGAG